MQDVSILNYEAEDTSAPKGVFWSAIFGGGLAAAALVLILMPLGAGMGFAAISPWNHAENAAGTFTMVAAIWLIVVQWLASGLGGYITGRLRTRWLSMHPHEGFFRDTAHGFLTWAVAAILIAGFSIFAFSHNNAPPAAGNHVPPMMAYDVDRLYRTERAPSVPIDDGLRAETGRILASNLVHTDNSDEDKSYLTHLVATHTGISVADAASRVDTVMADEKTNADNMRKAASALSFYSFFSMLMGAFIAAVAAALGGQHRDAHDQVDMAKRKTY